MKDEERDLAKEVDELLEVLKKLEVLMKKIATRQRDSIALIKDAKRNEEILLAICYMVGDNYLSSKILKFSYGIDLFNRAAEETIKSCSEFFAKDHSVVSQNLVTGLQKLHDITVRELHKAKKQKDELMGHQ